MVEHQKLIDQNMADYNMLEEYYYALTDEDFDAKYVTLIYMYMYMYIHYTVLYNSSS